MRSTRFFAILVLLLFVLVGCASNARRESPVDHDGQQRATVRIALTHWQDAGSERFEIQSLTEEGPWFGATNASWMNDRFGLYRCELVDPSSGRTIFVQGFCTVFGEWLTTQDSKAHPDQRFQESLRVPRFARPVSLRLLKRDRQNLYAPVFETTLDFSQTRPRPLAASDVTALGVSRDPGQCLDIAFLSEGYSALERSKFLDDAARLGDSLFRFEPYTSHRESVNLHAVFVASEVSGVSKPDKGIERSSALGCRYSTFGLPRYVLTLEDERVRSSAAAAPYDAIVILLNDSEYGGGGVFEQYCVVAADSPLATYLLIHEFGHSLTGLGDEYYTSPVAYQDFVAKNVEPWEPNVTALLNPTNLKWKALATPQVSLPTEWGKHGYEEIQKEAESKQNELIAKGQSEADAKAEVAQWRASRVEEVLVPRGVVGAFEGALYSSTGLYRPEVDCVMFRREATRYCRVCEATLRERILRFVQPRYRLELIRLNRIKVSRFQNRLNMISASDSTSFGYIDTYEARNRGPELALRSS